MLVRNIYNQIEVEFYCKDFVFLNSQALKHLSSSLHPLCGDKYQKIDHEFSTLNDFQEGNIT